MSSSTIQSLISEGVLVLYHDYRSGCFYDWSGNSNHGTPTNARLHRDGTRFQTVTSRIVVSDSPELQLTEMGIVVFGDFTKQENLKRLVSKQDAGGTNYDFFADDGPDQIRFYDGTATRSITQSIAGKKCIGLSVATGETGEAFVDGSSIGNLSGSSTITENDADLLIGNHYTLGAQFDNVVSAVLIANRKLTSAEHASIYSELTSMKWPTKPQFREPGGYEWISGWGAKEESGISAGQYVPGTPFMVSSGVYKISTETVNGSLCKVLECVNAGIIYMLASETRDGDTDNAYGTWDWWMSKGLSANVPKIYFISGDNAGNTGYQLRSGASDEIDLRETGVGIMFASGANAITPGIWNRFKVTRSATGEFSIYMDEDLLPAVSGSNPVTDNTTTVSKYIVFHLYSGDKICLGNVRGENGIAKHHSVV